jgi:Asp-tRNA(Asn)/Glu-tRNA(Gln) amidotransferase A subunit family amidase
MESTARRSFEDFVARFDVVEIKDDFAGALDVWAAICCWELRWPLAQYRDDLGADTKRFLDMGERMSRADYERALARRVELRLQYEKLAEQADVLVLPAATGPAPLGLAGTGSREFNAFSSGFGAPAITLPLLQVDGLPLGVQLMGFAGADARLLGHAAWLLATSSGTSS